MQDIIRGEAIKAAQDYPPAFDPELTPRARDGGTGEGNRKRVEEGGAEQKSVKEMVWLPLIWLLSILPSCILPMMETHRTTTDKNNRGRRVNR